MIPEPLGGAHRNPQMTIARVADAVEAALHDLVEVEGGTLRQQREEKYLAMGRAIA